jgi:hypothetical protein
MSGVLNTHARDQKCIQDVKDYLGPIFRCPYIIKIDHK